MEFRTPTGIPYAYKGELLGKEVEKLTSQTSPAQRAKDMCEVVANHLDWFGTDKRELTLSEVKRLLASDVKYILYHLIRTHTYYDVETIIIPEGQLKGIGELEISWPKHDEVVASTQGKDGTFPIVTVPQDDHGKPLQLNTYEEWVAYATQRKVPKTDFVLSPYLAGQAINVSPKAGFTEYINASKVMREVEKDGEKLYVTVNVGELGVRSNAAIIDYMKRINGNVDTTIMLGENEGLEEPTAVDVMNLTGFYLPFSRTA